MFAKHRCYRDYKYFFLEEMVPTENAPWGLRNDKKPRVQFGMRTWTTLGGIVGDGLVPIIFAGAWCCVLYDASSIVETAERVLAKS